MRVANRKYGFAIIAIGLGALSSGCSGEAATEGADETADEDLTAGGIVNLAKANLGKGPCSKNSLGAVGFATSCTRTDENEWCADFARWVWGHAGANTSGLTAGAGSFYTYGQHHGTLRSTPAVGDAVVFGYNGRGWAQHVAIVTSVHGKSFETISGNWGHLVRYSGEGDGMHISGFVKPVR